MLAGVRGIRLLQPCAAAIVAVLGLAACGGSSGGGSGSSQSASSNPQTLLKQTFSSAHAVRSGVLHVELQLTPKGSSAVTTPVTLSLDGPFQSGGAKQAPQSDFTMSASALGHKGSMGVISTGNAAFIRLQGTAYSLPASTVKALHKSLASGKSTGSAPGLSSLGIDPSRWLVKPQIVGTETVNGAQTKHLRAAVNVTAFVADVNKMLAKEAKAASAATSQSVPTRIPPATQRKIAAALKHPTVDLWTGSSDSTLRRLALTSSIPVTGQTSTELGGMTSAGVRLTIDYDKLNQSQTITAPAHPRSYAEFQAKLNTLGQQLEGALSGSGATGSTGSGTTGAGSSAQVNKYSKCINAAGGNVAKMQKCASLLNGGSQ